MGRPKALLPLSAEDSTSFIEAITDKTKNFGEQVVVSSLAPEALPTTLEVLEQTHPERGQLDSLQLAWRARRNKHPWALICPVDHPYFLTTTLTALFSARSQNPERWLWTPSYEKKGGHPVLFSSVFMEALLEAPAELGARPLLRKYHDRRYFLDTNDERVLWDVDTPEDYEKYSKKYQISG